MKIIALGPAFPYRGGIASFNDRLAQEFVNEGNDIEIFNFSLQYPGFLFPGKTQYTDGQPPAGIRISRNLNSINPFNWIFSGLKIRRKKPDILLIRYWIPFMAPCLGTIARIVKSEHTTVICIFDNVVPHEKRIGDTLLTKFFTNSIDGAIVMAGSVLDDLRKFRKNIPVRFNPHPLYDTYGNLIERNVALSKLNLDPECSYILFFGFIRAYKGLDLLIKAFSDKRLRNRNLKLIVAGEFYENDQPYRELIKQFDLESEIIFFDHFIQDNEVSWFFGAADLVVQPYKSATQSGVTQIAYYFEKPMLVTDVGGLKEIVIDGKCGYVVKPEPAQIAESLIDFYDNKRESVFTEGVKQEKERFTWDKMTATIMDIYRVASSKIRY